MKKFKRVHVRCFKDSQRSHYEEVFENITEKEFIEELNRMIEAGFWSFEINRNGQVKTLVLEWRPEKGI